MGGESANQPTTRMLETLYSAQTHGVMSEDFGDEIILVNLARGHYYSLRHTAAHVWRQVQSPASATVLSQSLSTAFAVETNEARQSLTPFFEQLKAEKLLVEALGKAIDGAISPLTAADRTAFTPPILEIHTDMQEVLRLDPIHDVDADLGWPVKK
jgi:hypothetical protein